MGLHKSNIITTGQVALNSSTATLVRDVTNSRTFLHLLNNDASILIYVGYSSAVSSSTGYILRAAGGTLNLENYTGPIYAIAASSTPSIIYAEY